MRIKPESGEFARHAQPHHSAPLPEMRRSYILDRLSEAGAVQVAAIAADLAVSEMTVRRDLADLEAAGRLSRVRGGAVRPEAARALSVDRDEPSFESRLLRQRQAKMRIAAAAAELTMGCRTVALDVGTTTYLLAKRLRERAHTTVFSNSVRNACALDGGLADVYLPGGPVRRDEMSISGAAAVAQFQLLWFDIAFIGVSGLAPSGVYDYSLDDADMKRVFLRRAGEKVLLCDSTKFQRMSLVRVAPLAEFNLLITDADPPDDIALALTDAGVKVKVARDPATR